LISTNEESRFNYFGGSFFVFKVERSRLYHLLRDLTFSCMNDLDDFGVLF